MSSSLSHSVGQRLPPPAALVDLREKSLYGNRELSWLEFNRRVLHEALDSRTPLLERVKFLAIFSSNQDEFFQVRIAGLREQVALKVTERGADGLSPLEVLEAARAQIDGMVQQHSSCLTDTILPELAQHGIVIHQGWKNLPLEERDYLDRYFRDHVFPVLTPLAVDPAHPFPHISNLSLSLAVTLIDEHGQPRFARVKVPELLPRWVPLQTKGHYLPLELLIGANIDSLFSGVELVGWHIFRITRNTDLNLEDGQGDNDEADDLFDMIQEEVRNRKFGEVVRLEVHETMPEAIRELLLAEFNEANAGEGLVLTMDDVTEVHGVLDATDLMTIASLERPELQDPTFFPQTPKRLTEDRDIFRVIREGDIFLHHPYDSFNTTVEHLIEVAVDDPDVLAIKITLYRTGSDIARLLARAAEHGKQVAVLIELQARFDEENNIEWARRFEEMGVHVSYGEPGLKTHTKVLLIVRREGNEIRRYVHVGTGNYNPKTARLYTDFGLLTCDDQIGADLTDLFNVLTGFAIPSGYRKLVVAPEWMKSRLLQAIRRETEHARHGRPARILAKMNALVHPEVIEALYQASRAGVQIDLIVRGICCLRPGVPGVSDNIRVISILGRFLEHSRAMVFRNGGHEDVLISSADWMPRNLDRRVEVAVPIEDARHRKTIRRLLEKMLTDNRQAWDMQPDGSYVQRHPKPGEPMISTHRF